MKYNKNFVKDCHPLTNRIWFKLDENFSSEKMYQNIKQHIETIPEVLTLNVNFYINKLSDQIFNNLQKILSNIFQFQVGYEKSFPVVSIYIPYEDVNPEFVEKINDLDKHRPGFNLYLLVRENVIPADNNLTNMRKIACSIFEAWKMSDNIGLNTYVYLFLETRGKMIDDYLRLRRLVYTWDTSCNMPAPLIQVSPKIQLTDDLIHKLLNYVDSEPQIIHILNTLCGVTSLIFRFSEQKDIPAKIIPLGSCGAAISEKTFYSDGSSGYCFHSDPSSISSKPSYDPCEQCGYVEACTGCLLMCNTDKKCEFTKLFTALLKEESV